MSFFYSTSQTLTKTDSLNIAFKAKLITISDYGISDKKEILNDLSIQELEFLNTTYKNFIFMKIKFNQPYRKIKSDTFLVMKECYYYLGFNIKTSQYYRIGGFNFNSIDSLIIDIETHEPDDFNFDNNPYIQEIDLNCLYEYHNTKPKKRLKKNISCFKNCISVKMFFIGSN